VSSKTDEALDRIFCFVVRAYIEHSEHTRRKILPSVPPRFRNNPTAALDVKFAVGGREHQIGATVAGTQVLSVQGDRVDALVNGVRYSFHMREHGSSYFVRSQLGQVEIKRVPRFPEIVSGGQHQTANSPMPGQVLRILVTEGQLVKPGDALIVLEAMKMEQTIKATIQGAVGAVLVKPAEIVAPGQMLVEIHSQEDADEHARSPAAKH
jgi:biotin carboxyl carrier protein